MPVCGSDWWAPIRYHIHTNTGRIDEPHKTFTSLDPYSCSGFMHLLYFQLKSLPLSLRYEDVSENIEPRVCILELTLISISSQLSFPLFVFSTCCLFYFLSFRLQIFCHFLFHFFYFSTFQLFYFSTFNLVYILSFLLFYFLSSKPSYILRSIFKSLRTPQPALKRLLKCLFVLLAECCLEKMWLFSACIYFQSVIL